MRALLAALGCAVMAYGGWLLLSRQQPGQVREVLVWLAGGVILHDAVLAPAVALLGWLGGSGLPRPAARGAAAVLVLLGPTALIAIPVVGRFGARADNPTLLPRDYTHGLLAFAAACLLAGLAVGVSALRSPPRGSHDRDKER